MPTVRAGDADIAYEVQGDGDPLLLVMGFAMGQHMWIGQLPAFTPHYKVITFDNRGIGMSSAPPGPYSMEQMAADALAVLDAAGAERAHVVGVSMGGAIAQHLALKAPERVRSLTLAATWPGRNAWHERLFPLLRRIGLELDTPAFIATTLHLLFSPRFVITQPELLAMIDDLISSLPMPIEPLVAQGEACQAHDVRDRLGQVRAPTLVVGGKRDVFIPPELSQEIASLVPGSELHLLETGHAFIFEEADQFNRLVLEFLARQA